MGFRDTTDGECIGTGTQRNRRSDVLMAYYRVPVGWRARANLTNPGLGETSETSRRKPTPSESSQLPLSSSSPGCK